MKNITQDQIKQVLALVYQTNITASQFDSLKEFFAKLPNVPEPKKEEGK